MFSLYLFSIKSSRAVEGCYVVLHNAFYTETVIYCVYLTEHFRKSRIKCGRINVSPKELSTTQKTIMENITNYGVQDKILN